ncbi:serine/threonine-protein kinase Sgk2 [Xylaria scruposa]|nr:serine/threonine-protein kinase Sgk2 [Xylaria scruposa]
MTLTEKHIKIISEHPLNDTFDHIRDELRDNANDLQQKNIVSLLEALIRTAAASNITCPDRGGRAAGRLVCVLYYLQKGKLDLNHFSPLVRNVVGNSSDTILWDTALTLINALNLPTPPLFNPTFVGTTIEIDSSRLVDSESAKAMEEEVFKEIRNCTFRNVVGFWDKFFEPENWREGQKAMLKEIMTEYDYEGKKWIEFPAITNEELVWNWLRSLEIRFLADAPHKVYITQTAHQLQQRKGQMDMFFVQRSTAKEENIYEYKDVLVVGLFNGDLLQLAHYVRSIFYDQPTRRFVHAFSFCASKMELWIFDRSGPYSSGIFDIHEEPDKFARAFIGYATMDNDMMGLDTFIQRGNGDSCITLDDATGHNIKLWLDTAIFRYKATVGRGTTCYETQDNSVAKFSWASDKRERRSEVEQLTLAAERNVQGVATVVAYHQITTIKVMREGLVFPNPHNFKDDDGVYSRSARTSANISGKKRKLSTNHTSDNTPKPKRLRPDSLKLIQDKALISQSSIYHNEPSLYKPTNNLWENKIYSCLVVSPAGRVISDFKTIKELLESMRDAIRAHRSLYITGNILHRDISPNNIIITKPETETPDSFKGMLIDLDRASSASGPRYWTGTIQFMAIEVLNRVDHTYRHDLESFFYVLIWMCARQSWWKEFSGKERPPKQSLLKKWVIGSFPDIARYKRGYMMTNIMLRRILNEFPKTLDSVKPLCYRIREILFQRRMFLGTPAGDPNQLYVPIIEAYDTAIRDL